LERGLPEVVVDVTTTLMMIAGGSTPARSALANSWMTVDTSENIKEKGEERKIPHYWPEHGLNECTLLDL